MRNLIRAGLVMLCMAVAGTSPPVMAQTASSMISVGSWFKVQFDTPQDWQLRLAPDDPRIVQIKPKRLLSSRPLRRVLVLYPRASSAYDTAISKMIDVLGDKRIDTEWTINNFELDTARGRAALAEAEAKNVDLVVAMGSESTAWLWSNYRGGRIPVVAVCSKDPVLLGQMKDYESGSSTNFAFTSLNMPIDAQMSYVLQLKPGLKNLAILVDANNLSAVQTQSKPAADFARARGIRVFDIAVKNPARVREEIAAMVRETVNTMRKNDPELTNSLFWITGSTLVFGEMATINANSFRVPILSAVTDLVQAGDATAALSVGVSFESNAHQAALYAVAILEGQKVAGDLPVGLVSPPDVAISFRKAREIGLRIPFPLYEGATVVYDNDGSLVRSNTGQPVTQIKSAEQSKQDGGATAPTPPTSSAYSIE